MAGLAAALSSGACKLVCLSLANTALPVEAAVALAAATVGPASTLHTLDLSQNPALGGPRAAGRTILPRCDPLACPSADRGGRGAGTREGTEALVVALGTGGGGR